MARGRAWDMVIRTKVIALLELGRTAAQIIQQLQLPRQTMTSLSLFSQSKISTLTQCCAAYKMMRRWQPSWLKEELLSQILHASLEEILTHGWSLSAVKASVTRQGYPSVAAVGVAQVCQQGPGLVSRTDWTLGHRGQCLHQLCQDEDRDQTRRPASISENYSGNKHGRNIVFRIRIPWMWEVSLLGILYFLKCKFQDFCYRLWEIMRPRFLCWSVKPQPLPVPEAR